MKEVISVGIIGAGYMAEEHIKAFQAFGNIVVSGIYSRTHEKAVNLSAKYNIPHVCNSVGELYVKGIPDLLIVAVTETAVEQLVSEIINYPWAVLFEKPLGLNYEQSRRICDQLERRKTRAIVAFNRRFYSSTKHVVEDLKYSSGTRFIQVNDYQNLDIAKSFQYSEEIINQWMFANSIHLIDYFYIFGRGNLKKVSVVQKWNPEILSPVIAHLEFESGDQGIYQGIWHGPGPWSISVTTNSDHFEMKPLEVVTKKTATDLKLIYYTQAKKDLDFKPGLYEQAKNALEFVKLKPSTSVTIYESLKSMELISKIYHN